MRRLDAVRDRMEDIVTYEFDDGRRIAFDGRDLRKYGLAEMMKHQGITPSPERIDVFQGRGKIGTVPAYFDPLAVKSTNFFYEPRRGDFTRTERGWEAAAQLGPGDIDAIPEFVWDDSDYQAGRAARREEDTQLLREAMFAPRDSGSHSKSRDV